MKDKTEEINKMVDEFLMFGRGNLGDKTGIATHWSLTDDFVGYLESALTTQKAEFIKIIDKHTDPLYFRTLDCTNLDVEPPTTEKGMRWEESKKIFIKNVKAELEREDR